MKTPVKISEMVADFADQFIGMGVTPDERQNLLNTACSAWNCACAPEEQRLEHIDRYIAEYQKHTPEADADDCAALRENMLKLVAQKLKRYPNVIKQIVACDLKVANGEDHITVASLRREPKNNSPSR
jgi:hypothetical protein